MKATCEKSVFAKRETLSHVTGPPLS
ncbi:hypothetical protein MPLB_2040030 [Mesorhizobium sp. ORS 3324]|nr:hypothetical protein MPLB_2040030 [Mesorhizobium sp. ORS 3324]